MFPVLATNKYKHHKNFKMTFLALMFILPKRFGRSEEDLPAPSVNLLTSLYLV